MFFEQFYLGCLAHASYMLGSGDQAIVVDPQRDVDLYLEVAAREGFRISGVIETHFHADFVSGHRELAERTGADIYLGRRAEAAFPHRRVGDGDELTFGRCRLRFLETPGHTLESISVLVTDVERSPEPFAVLTGDTLFIGEVGRPDLSEQYTPQQLAAMLYDSLWQKLLTLPDEIVVYPAHGAGSMCGRNIGQSRNSTIGEQRRFNYALQVRRKEDFVRLLTADLPPRPGYFLRDAEINRRGARALDALPPLLPLDAHQVDALPGGRVLLLDTRAGSEYSSAHIPGSLQIGLNGQYAMWAGALIGLDQEVILVASDRPAAEESRNRLARVGIEKVTGYLDGGIAAWAAAGKKLVSTGQISIQELSDCLRDDRGGVQVLDVRRPTEWKDGHLPGALLNPLDHFPTAGPPLDPERPVAAHCKSGYRSIIACSLLERAGFREPLNVPGGFDAWQAAGLPYQKNS